MQVHSIDFDSMEDEKILSLIRDNNDDALDYLMNKYSKFVKLKAQGYFLIGADREDLIQEGMIGLFKAIRDFKDDKNASFKSFAQLCITRQIITAIKSATRQKHSPLNSYVSLNKPLAEGEESSYIDFIYKVDSANPEEIMINKEQYDHIEVKINEVLSEYECNVLAHYLQGKSYQQIGLILMKDPKSIDNALQRIKKKIESVISETP